MTVALTILKRFAVFALTLHALASVSVADITMPTILTSNNILFRTNESEVLGVPEKKYPVRWMLDRDVETAWVFEPNPAILKIRGSLQPQIWFHLPEGVIVDEIGIINGHTKSSALYAANNRIRRISVIFKDDATQEENLVKDLEMQRIRLDREVTSRFSITIDDVWRGERFDNTCVSEIDLFFRGRSLIPRGPLVESPGGRYAEERLIEQTGKVLFSPGTEGDSKILFSHSGEYVAFGSSVMGMVRLEHEDDVFGIAVTNALTGRTRAYFPGMIAQPVGWSQDDSSLDCRVRVSDKEGWTVKTIVFGGFQALP